MKKPFSDKKRGVGGLTKLDGESAFLNNGLKMMHINGRKKEMAEGITVT